MSRAARSPMRMRCSRALRDGVIGGAALDTLVALSDSRRNPISGRRRHPFHELPNVIMTPHCSAWTEGMARRRRRRRIPQHRPLHPRRHAAAHTSRRRTCVRDGRGRHESAVSRQCRRRYRERHQGRAAARAAVSRSSPTRSELSPRSPPPVPTFSSPTSGVPITRRGRGSRLVQSVATGIEWIDAGRLAARRSAICNAYGHETAIAEYVLMVMLVWSPPLSRDRERFPAAFVMAAELGA